ncbi:polysaccharide biosynthesis/export family protein [soil metagenome]
MEIWHEPLRSLGNLLQSMRLLTLIVLAAVASAAVGCGDDPPVVYPTVAPFDDTKLALGPGDKLELTIYYGSKESKSTYTLDSAGQMEVQFIGTVNARSKTKKDVQSEIQTRLADGFLKDPVVSLIVVEINSLRCTVSGQVIRNGDIKFTPGMSIVEAIAQSGGFTPLARKNLVQVTRGADTYKIPVELIAEGKRPNFPIMPGDRIFVPERAW